MAESPPVDFRERTFQFACAIAKLCQKWPAEGTHQHLRHQLLRAGTSIGANVEEAKAAYSKREFVMKMFIALKEARETLYWLRIARESGLAPSTSCASLLAEADQLVAILTATVRTARANLRRSERTR